MSERELTLVELHFHNHGDVQVGSKTKNTGSRTGLRSRLRRSQQSSDEDGERRRSIPIPFAVAGVALLAFVALAWRTVAGR